MTNLDNIGVQLMDTGLISSDRIKVGEQAFIDRAREMNLDIEALWLMVLIGENDQAFDEFMECSNAAFVAAQCEMRSSAHVVIHFLD